MFDLFSAFLVYYLVSVEERRENLGLRVFRKEAIRPGTDMNVINYLQKYPNKGHWYLPLEEISLEMFNIVETISTRLNSLAPVRTKEPFFFLLFCFSNFWKVGRGREGVGGGGLFSAFLLALKIVLMYFCFFEM